MKKTGFRVKPGMTLKRIYVGLTIETQPRGWQPGPILRVYWIPAFAGKTRLELTNPPAHPFYGKVSI
jgi:hypothetical protein